MSLNYSKHSLLLEVNNVSFKYEEKQVLKDISFKIHDIHRPGVTQGQIVSVCARSGAGKSTLFKLLSGYNKPKTGIINVGADQHTVQTGEMGVVPQDYPLFNHRTVQDNLALALSSMKGKEKLDTIKSYTDHFELTEHLEKYPCELSGGQRQRVSILQQVLAGNKFILLDEPFSGLDTLMKDKVIDLLIKISNLDEMNTLIIVSHDIESTCAISDTVFVLSNKNGEGSTITKTYDFLTEGLAYQPGVKEMPRFRQIIQEIKSLI